MPLTLWTLPDHYSGYNPMQDYLLATVHRESNVVTRSNFISWQAKLAKVSDVPELVDDEEPTDQRASGWFYVWRATHPMVGWVDYLMLRGDAPQALIDKAEEITEGLDDYPVVDEFHLSELENEDEEAAWKALSLRERVDLCKRAEVSIMAARHDWPPNDDQGMIREILVFG